MSSYFKENMVLPEVIPIVPQTSGTSLPQHSTHKYLQFRNKTAATLMYLKKTVYVCSSATIGHSLKPPSKQLFKPNLVNDRSAVLVMLAEYHKGNTPKGRESFLAFQKKTKNKSVQWLN